MDHFGFSPSVVPCSVPTPLSHHKIMMMAGGLGRRGHELKTEDALGRGVWMCRTALQLENVNPIRHSINQLQDTPGKLACGKDTTHLLTSRCWCCLVMY